MLRAVVTLALTWLLVIAPYTRVAIAVTLQQPSTQSEDTHEEREETESEREAHASSRGAPPAARRWTTIVPSAVPPAPTARPSLAPPLHPAKYSERRLI